MRTFTIINNESTKTLSHNIVGIKPPDDKWRKMEAVYDACTNANVSIPEEVTKFFYNFAPNEKGTIIGINYHHAVSEYEGEAQSGYEVRIKELPQDIDIIRFYASW